MKLKKQKVMWCDLNNTFNSNNGLWKNVKHEYSQIIRAAPMNQSVSIFLFIFHTQNWLPNRKFYVSSHTLMALKFIWAIKILAMCVLKFSMIKTEYLKITPWKGNLYIVQAVIILLLELTCTKSSSQFIKVLLQI